jgi:L-cystine uptake protein TcyP (sodium:dicarboxylate symporter family)
MKISKIEYYIFLTIITASAVAALVNIFDSQLFSDNTKMIFKGGLFIGFIWLLTRGKNYLQIKK